MNLSVNAVPTWAEKPETREKTDLDAVKKALDEAIANAPTWLRSLVEDVEEYKRLATWWNEQCVEAWKWRDINADTIQYERGRAESAEQERDRQYEFNIEQIAKYAALEEELVQLRAKVERLEETCSELRSDLRAERMGS